MNSGGRSYTIIIQLVILLSWRAIQGLSLISIETLIITTIPQVVLVFSVSWRVQINPHASQIFIINIFDTNKKQPPPLSLSLLTREQIMNPSSEWWVLGWGRVGGTPSGSSGGPSSLLWSRGIKDEYRAGEWLRLRPSASLAAVRYHGNSTPRRPAIL